RSRQLRGQSSRLPDRAPFAAGLPAGAPDGRSVGGDAVPGARRSGSGARRVARAARGRGDAVKPRRWWLSSVTAILVGILIWGCLGRSAAPANLPMQNIGSWRVGVGNDPDPPRVGENT